MPSLENAEKRIVLTGAALLAGVAFSFGADQGAKSVSAADGTPTPARAVATLTPTLTPIPTPTFDAPRATQTSRANVDAAFGRELATIQAGYTALAGKTAIVEATHAAATAIVETRQAAATATAYADYREDVRASRGGFPLGVVVIGGFLGIGGVGGGVYLGLGRRRRAALRRRINHLLDMFR